MERYRAEAKGDSAGRRERQLFFDALYTHWQATVGTVLGSVGMALYGAQGGTVPVGVLFILSIVALLWGAFLTWRDQHRLRLQTEADLADLKERIRPKISWRCGDVENANSRDNDRVFQNTAIPIKKCDFMGIIIKNEGVDAIDSCQVWLKSISRGKHALPIPQRRLQFEPVNFGQRIQEHISPITETLVLGGTEVALALCTIREDGFIFHGSLGHTWGENLSEFAELFKEQGVYCFVLEVRGRGLEPKSFRLDLNWRGERKTADFSKPPST